MAAETGINLAKAYVQIIPSVNGISGNLAQVFGDEGTKAGGRFSGKFKGALKTLGKSALIGLGADITATAAGMGKLVKSAAESYAEYEQLVGGVETLFKDSAGVVQQYADNAYKTAGLSANEYMETVTSFSASLLQSLDGDTAQAASVADMAISDMADNANKMGSSIESIQNAYQGFAKQNYTMLDNLKLGYGGTKEEMKRLLADAQKLTGIEYDLENLNDVYSAIHAIQTEMGITGTTAQEAEHTISGSLASLKGAWQNLLVGFADDNADLDSLIDNVVSSAEIALDNLMPVIEHALTGIADFIGKAVPIISERLPELVQKILPPLIQAATALLVGLVKALPEVLKVLTDQAPFIVKSIGGAIIEAAPVLLEAAAEIVATLLMGLFDGLGKLAKAGADMVKAVGDSIKERVKEALNWGRDLISNFIQGIKDRFGALKDTVTWAAGIVKGYLGFSEPDKGPLSNFHTFGPDMMDLFAQGIRSNLDVLRAAARDAALAATPETPTTALRTAGALAAPIYAGGPAGAGDGTLTSILAILERYFPELTERAVVLDSGTMVGKMAPLMNEALGQIATRRQRTG